MWWHFKLEELWWKKTPPLSTSMWKSNGPKNLTSCIKAVLTGWIKHQTESVFSQTHSVFSEGPLRWDKNQTQPPSVVSSNRFLCLSVCPCAWNFRTWRESFVFIPFKCLGPFVYLFYWYRFFLRHPRFLIPTSVFFLFSVRLTVALITDCVIVSVTSCKWIALLESIMASEATSYSPGRLSVTQENILITKSSQRRIQKYSFLNDGSLDVE